MKIPDRLFSEIELYTSEACNLACKYCFLPKNPRDAKKETLEAILKWFFENSQPKAHVHIFGTEPLHRWQLLKYTFNVADSLAQKMKKRLTKGVTTNCVALTKSHADWMTKHRVSALCSIDGMKENHNKWRVFPNGKGSYDTVAKHAAYWVKLNPRAEAAMTVTPEVIPKLVDNMRAVYELGFHAVAMNKMEDTGPKYTSRDLNRFEGALFPLMDLIIDYAKKGRKVYAMFLTNGVVKRARNQSGRNPTHTCGAAKGSISTNIDGDIFICHRALYDGEIFKLGDVFNGIDWEKVRWWRSRTHRGCTWCQLPDCSPCYTDSYHRHGDPFVISWQNCRFNQIVTEMSFELEKRMKKEGVYKWWMSH